MELLLNLFWLLLVIPAYWVWRRRDERFDVARCALILCCALVLLFPVISASDDLHPMRAEIEESSPGKHALKHAVDVSSVQKYFHVPPAILTSACVGLYVKESCGLAFTRESSPLIRIQADFPSPRAPPVRSIA